MSEASKKNDSGMVKLTVTLGAICTVCALVLGLVNQYTEPKIAALQEAKKASAIGAEVMPGFSGTLSPVNYTGTDGSIRSVQKAGEDGFIVEVAPAGSFSGTLTLMVGVANDKTVTGLSVVESAETSGLGDRVKEEEFRSQFVGLTGEIKVTKDGGVIEAVSGATISSRAVALGVTSAVAAVDMTNDDPYVPVEKPEAEEPKEEDLIPGFTGEVEAMAYTGADATIRSLGKAGDMGYVVEVAPADSYSGTLVVQIGIGTNNVVTGVKVLESGETEGLGARVSELDFRSQFVGKSGEVKLSVDGGEIDAVAGATISSRAMANAVNSALAAVPPAGGVIPDYVGELTAVEYAGTDSTIRSISKAGEAGYVVEVAAADSFSGTLSFWVGISADNTVTGISIFECGETANLGERVMEADFRNQFTGKTGEVKVTADGGEIEAISGATISSRAVANGVTSALAAVAALS